MMDNKKEIYLKLLADKIQAEFPDPLYPATITLKFNFPLLSDEDGMYAIIYAKDYNTPDAELIKTGRTYGCKEGITFDMLVPKCGIKIVFKALGLITAQYVEYEKCILPGNTTVWLNALYEHCYAVIPDDDDFGDDDDNTSHPNYFLQDIQNIM